MKVQTADEKLRMYKSNWMRYVTRMKSKRIPRIMLNCRPNGQRRHGRLPNRLTEEAEQVLIDVTDVTYDDDDDNDDDEILQDVAITFLG